MKKVIFGLLLTGAIGFAKGHSNAKVDQDALDQQRHMAWYTKDALRTQSPRIHLAKTGRHEKAIQNGDQLEVNKTTISAFVPYGK